MISTSTEESVNVASVYPMQVHVIVYQYLSCSFNSVLLKEVIRI